jgi:hypothetical protein
MHFTLSLSPTSGTGNASYTVTVSSHNGFQGAVTLSATGPGNPTVSPGTVYLSPGGVASATCSVGNVTTGGTLTVTGTGSSGSQSATASIAAGDFQISVAPASDQCNKSYTVTVNSINNYGGAISLTPSINPAGTGLGLNANPLNLTPGGNNSAICAVQTAVDPSTLTVAGAGPGPLNRSATASVQASDFTIALSPSSITGSGSFTITVTSQNNFSGMVQLSRTWTPDVPGYATLSATSVTVSAGGSATATCMVNSGGQAHTLTVTGSYAHPSRTIYHSANATVNA